MQRIRRKTANPYAGIRDVSKRTVAFWNVGTVLKVVEVHVNINIRVQFNGVKGVLTVVVVTQGQINLGR